MRIVKAAVLLVLLGGVFQVARGMSRDDARSLALEELDKAATRAAAADAIVRLGAPPELVAALRGEGSLPATDAWLATLPRGDAARVRSALAGGDAPPPSAHGSAPPAVGKWPESKPPRQSRKKSGHMCVLRRPPNQLGYRAGQRLAQR
jgi:hypothetical protein